MKSPINISDQDNGVYKFKLLKTRFSEAGRYSGIIRSRKRYIISILTKI